MTDPESPIGNFTLAVLDARLVPLHAEPLDLTATTRQFFTYAEAEPFREYIFYLRATNAAGLASRSESISIYVDPDLPSANGHAVVCDDHNRPRSVQWFTDSLRLCIQGVVPPTSGVAAHAITVRNAETLEVVVNTSISHRSWPANSASFVPFPDHELAAGDPTPVLNVPNLSLPCGARLIVAAIPVSGASQVSESNAFTSTELQIDCTPPVINASLVELHVPLAPAAGTGWEAHSPACLPRGAREVVFSWSGVIDAESGVASYSIQTATVTSANGTNETSLSPSIPVGLQQHVAVSVAHLVPSGAHYLVLNACNGAGLCATVDSRPRYIYLMDAPNGGTATLHTPSVTPGFLSTSAAEMNTSWTFPVPMSRPERVEYEACLGTTPTGCQLRPFTHVGTAGALDFGQPQTRCGASYYAAVRATDCAGQQRTIASAGVKVCCDPPTGGIVTVADAAGDAVTYLTDQASATISWDGFVEPCSGVREYLVSVVRLDGGAEQLVWQSVLYKVSSIAQQRVTLDAADIASLPAEATVIAKVLATSHAGHLRVSSSPVMFIDRLPPLVSPPTFTYVEPTGLVPNPPESTTFTAACIPPHVPYVSLHINVRDEGSGLTTTKLASTVRANATADDSTLVWAELGPLREIHIDATKLAIQGETFYLLHACDRVGQCAFSNWSLGVNVMGRAPTGGSVAIDAVVGGRYLPSPDSLRPTWSGFRASGCPELCGSHRCFHDWTCGDAPPRKGGLGCNAAGIGAMCRVCDASGLGQLDACPDDVPPSYSDIGGLMYEVCIGTTPTGCQLRPFTHVGMGANWQVPDPSLRCGATYYAMVRATNCAGLQRTVTSSDVQICCEPPTKGVVSVTDAFGKIVTYQPEWDPTSNATNVTISWLGFVESCSGVRQYVVSVVRLSESGAELETMWQSQELASSRWSVTLANTTLAALPSDTTYLAKVVATSYAEHSQTSSATFTVDSAPPALSNITLRWPGSTMARTGRGPTCVPTTVEQIEISWAAAHDVGSTVVVNSLGVDPGSGDSYKWEELDAFKTATRSANLLLGINGTSHQSVTLAARSCDQAGMCTVSNTHEVVPVRWPPAGGEVSFRAAELSAVVTAGLLNSTDASLRVDWLEFAKYETHTPSLQSVSDDALEYEVCIGTTPKGCQLLPFARVGAADSLVIDQPQMRCGATYYAAVRATDCAGLQHTSASAGVKVCCDPPVDGVVTVMDAAGVAVTYLTDQASATISWDGFIEPCSGVREYAVTVLHLVGDAEKLVWQSVASNTARSVTLDAADIAALPAEAELVARVVATSHAEHSGRADFAFIIDRTPPLFGSVYDSAGFTDVFCVHANQSLEVSWSGFSDPTAGVAFVEWGIGRHPGWDDVMPFQRVDGKDRGYASVDPSTLSVSLDVGMTLFNSIRVRNRAGLETVASSTGLAIVLRDCEAAAICMPLRPHSAISSGVHPMFAALLYGFVQLGGRRLTYDITGDALTPQDGNIRLEAVVHMQKEGTRTDGARLVSLHVERARTIDRHGAAHAVDEFAGLHRSPTYYWQSSNGTILEVQCSHMSHLRPALVRSLTAHFHVATTPSIPVALPLLTFCSPTSLYVLSADSSSRNGEQPEPPDEETDDQPPSANLAPRSAE